ncbi:hypothetical protein SAMD00019534_074830, partial [Acytostelium subglobosum LB1]|uniref:hypothetical protein n=1 Tax=Acytostelium subglobosum LB1 TaxID=1410327 RepID=UPI000644F893
VDDLKIKNKIDKNKSDKELIVIEEIDVDLPIHKEYFDLYKYDVPVCMVDKKLLFKHRINDEDKLYYEIDRLFQQAQQQDKTTL